MQEAEFDRIADEYEAMHRANISASGDDPAYFARYKIEDVRKDRKRRGLSLDGELTILDFGSGVGASVPYLKDMFPKARILALDVSRRSLEINQSKHQDAAAYIHYDGRAMQIESDSVDFAVACCVFHHIPHADHTRQIEEIRRVLKPGGDLYIFEHNPWNPLTLHAVNTCPFDENAELINGVKMKNAVAKGRLSAAGPVYRYFFPAPLKAFRPLERSLRFLPVGAQYYVRGAKPAAG